MKRSTMIRDPTDIKRKISKHYGTGLCQYIRQIDEKNKFPQKYNLKKLIMNEQEV